MAKISKVTSNNQRKPITAFFSPANKGGLSKNLSQDTPLSRVSSQSQSVAPQAGAQWPSKLKLTNGSTATRALCGSKGSEAQRILGTPTRKSERRANQQTSFLSSSAPVSSLKRSRTPDAQLRMPSKSISSHPKTPERRKNKFDTDSDSDTSNLDAVVHVKSVRGILIDFL